jgi:alkanesulfonate monooxygenase SsuD/methylene tetrahydromethanopterin reductase-like flavin-dependent oxidoreductase (luciferase family)
MSANFLLSKYLKSHWTNYALGKSNVGQVADIGDWRIARTIFVADDEATARRYAIESPDSPYRYYWNLLLKKMMLSKRHAIFKENEAQSDAELTIEYMLDKLVLWGTPERVAERILELREEAGPFGEIVYANMDWVDEKLARRSIELMATEVMPRVNAAITGSTVLAKAAA